LARRCRQAEAPDAGDDHAADAAALNCSGQIGRYFLRVEIAALRKQIQDTMYLAEPTINMIFNHALVDIMSRRAMRREEIVAELSEIPLRHIGGRPDLESMAHNIVGARIARMDGRTIAPVGHA
jgi:hypothetical protein